MSKIARFFIRVSAFLGKEIFSILRQPMLVATLVLGPFLILLLFGLGFQNKPPALRTLFVVPQTETDLAKQLESYVTTLGPQLIFMGVTSDRAKATEQLLRRQIDVVAIIPADAAGLIRRSQQVVIELNHYEIDPFKIDYVNIFGQVYADEINRRVLREITQKGQQETTPVHDLLENTRQTITDLRAAWASDNQAAASQQNWKAM
jgi:ABC-2 type transport system permease protein